MRLRFLVPLCLVVLLSPGAPACGDKDPERVEITVVVVLAHDRDAKVDPKLKCFVEQVKKKDPKLTGLQMGSNTCKGLTLGDKATFPLADGHEATVEVKRCTEKPERFCLKVKAKPLGEITYSVVCGKYMPFDTNTKTKAGERLFLAVMVKPCPEKGKKD